MAPPSLDMPPPWQVFPAMTPQQLGATQGAEEQWFDGMWRPYWQSLDAAGQEACHARWNTSPAWRESIAFFCRAMSEAELAEDARESEAALRQYRAARAAAGAGVLGGLRAWVERLRGLR